jgi:hypothetical protein
VAGDKIAQYKAEYKIHDHKLVIFSVEAPAGAINEAGIDWPRGVIKHQCATKRCNDLITDWKQYSKLMRLAYEWVGRQVTSYKLAAAGGARAAQRAAAARGSGGIAALWPVVSADGHLSAHPR